MRMALASWQPAVHIASEPLPRIAAAWKEIVGERVAAHCTPIELSGDALLIATHSSAWSQQLQFLSPTIMKGVHALGVSNVVRLRFRSGKRRLPERSGAAVAPAFVKRLAPRLSRTPCEPALDAWDALDRVRRRLDGHKRDARRRCAACGVMLCAAEGPSCAPCSDAIVAARFVATQRALYAMPWLAYAALREQLPDLEAKEYERARRHLLARWWLMLERARRAGRLSPDGFERQIASSYVLLHSRLPPDRLTSAIVHNVLGAELAQLVWGCEPVLAK